MSRKGTYSENPMNVFQTLQKVGRRWLQLRGIKTRWIETAVGKLAVLEGDSRGSLPPLVVQHGLGSSAISFSRVLLKLLPHVSHLVAVDAPGHGLSHVNVHPVTPDVLFSGVEEAILAVTREPFFLAGNSLGGAMAIKFTLAHPEKVRGLFLTSPGGALSSEQELEQLRKLFHLENNEQTKAFLAKLFHQPPWYMPLLYDEFRGLISSRTVRSFFEHVSHSDGFQGEELKQIQCPITLVWGKSDRILPRAQLDFFKKHLPPRTDVQEPEHFGHSPQMEYANDMASRILAFMQTCQHG